MSEYSAKAQNVGGSALIRGVMMGANGKIGAAARREDGTISVAVLFDGSKPSRIPARLMSTPAVRGVVGVGRGLGLAVDALRWSAAQQDAGAKLFEGSTMKRIMVVTYLLLAAFFGIVPAILAIKVAEQFGGGVITGLVEGVIRLSIFIGYLALISRMKHIQDVFAYHGAEHKVVSTYESNRPLTPEVAATFSRLHPRCGTNYVLLLLIGCSLGAAFTVGMPNVIGFPLRIVILFAAAGLAYELMKAAALNLDRRWAKVVTAPGLALQRITTREPDAGQLEIAIMALRSVLTSEQLEELENRSDSALVAA